MKKTTSKPAGTKKPVATKKAPTKKSAAKPKRKAQSADMALLVEILNTNFSRLNNNDQEIMRAVERHAKIAGRLATAAEELGKNVRQLTHQPASFPRALPPEEPHQHTDELSDDMEAAGSTKEAPEE